MTTLLVPLTDILTDADNPLDLTALPTDEAIRVLKETYAFLPGTVQVTIEDGVASISFGDDVDASGTEIGDSGAAEQAQRLTEQAQRKIEQASGLAKRGKLRQAIPLFQEGLKVLPDHADGRRELAMALMHTGSPNAAKGHLIRVLQLKPDSAWAHLILGNIYFQFEQDLGSAERYYQAAYDLDPTDVYLLSSFGTLKAQRSDWAAAEELLTAAIEADKSYPNPRHALALAYFRQDKIEDSLNTVEALFEIADGNDPSQQTVLTQARQLYLDLNTEIAENRFPGMIERLEQAMADYEADHGYPIQLEEDANLTKGTCTAELAWVYNRPHHLIRYQPADRARLGHLIASRLESIQMITLARDAETYKLFTTTADQRKQVQKSFASDFKRLEKRGPSKAEIERIANNMIYGLTNQLFNNPLDMILDQRIYAKYPELRQSQFVSMTLSQQEGLHVLHSEEIRGMAPRKIYQANVAMNCATAHFMDDLFGQRTNYAAAYQKSGMQSVGLTLYKLWQKAVPTLTPGDEFALVDAFAKQLKLTNWYTWQSEEDSPSRTPQPTVGPTPPSDPISQTTSGADGPTNPELLEAKEPATVMYLLDALRTFENMDLAQVNAITQEVALIGMNGLDYASNEKQYVLKTLPDDRYTGLQLMAYMHVGLKIVEPDIDSGMPFEEAYEAALKIHRYG